MIIPVPKRVKKGEGSLLVSEIKQISFVGFTPEEQNHLVLKCQRTLGNLLIVDGNADLIITKTLMPDQAYALGVTQSQITIQAGAVAGAHYALTTLSQLIVNKQIACIDIYDEPDLAIRGVMLDISRSKVPTLDTLKQIVDWLEILKYNHLELYVEGFSFEYKSFPEVLSALNYLTVVEYQALEAYCMERGIDLVPNQNGFGHMSEWLKRAEFKDLAETPDGFFIWGAHREPSTLNPLNPRSFELVSQMYHDMLPYSKSGYFNMNFDEPYELGHGKSKAYCDQVGKETVFIEYLEKLADVVRSYGKRPMIWGDVLIHHPESLPRLSKDLIFIDWGYSTDYPFYRNLKLLSDAQISFMAAAGTSTWAVITARYLDMIGSIRSAVGNTIKYQGMGILVTDWGDMGHLQYLPFSYPGFIFGAMSSWNYHEAHEYLISPFLSRVVENALLAQLILDMSNYTRLEGEYRSYGSRLFSTILWAEHTRGDKEAFLEKMQYNLLAEQNRLALHGEFDNFHKRLKALADLTPQAEIVQQELLNALKLLKTLLKINDLLATKHYTIIDEVIDELNQFLMQHEKLWCLRNKSAGLVESSRRIKQLISVLEKIKEGS